MRAEFFLTLIPLLASPAHAAWDSFEIIQWQQRDAARLTTLRQLGISAVTVIANRDGSGTPLEQQTAAPRATGLRWYIENIATDFYSPYHQYTRGKPEHWRFLAAQERYRASPDDNTALFRQPPLTDPAWRARIGARLRDTVRDQKRHKPLYYSLGDEAGIGDLSAFWDFDLSPSSVAGFQDWLRSEYKSLDALNAQWGTAHRAWNAIPPETTRQAMRRADDNFSAWNDFKAWMDTSFAQALRFGTDAVHRADPDARAGIEGAQIPGWGGYDYTKLAHAVDVIEIYDDGENLPILRSLNPRVIPLVTSGSATLAALHGLWREVLRGARGLILWDEDDSIVGPDGVPGPRGQAYAPVFAALRGAIGRRMIKAEPLYDSVAILYSPVSFRVRWMLDHRAGGDAWMHRSAEIELGDNAYRAALRDYAAALARMGLRPRFITPEQLAGGPPAERVLILPHALALSEREIRSVTAFRGQVIADVPPGQFDGHARRRVAPPVAATLVPPAGLGRVLTLAPPFRVEAPGSDVDTYLFRSHGRRLLALHRRAPGGAAGPVTVHLKGWRARDLVTDRMHDGGPLSLTLDPVTPVFLEISR